MRGVLAALALAALPIDAKQLSDKCLNQVYDVMHKLNTYSWENGTMGQAILEWKYPKYSVFSPTAPLPVPDSVKIDEIVKLAQITLQNRPAANAAANEQPVNAAGSSSAVSGSASSSAPAGTSSVPTRKRQANSTSTSSSSSHSASATSPLNIPARQTPGLPAGSPLLADGAAGDPPSLGVSVLLASKATNNAQVNSVSYGDAAQSQLNFILYHVPRTANGAISHREKSAQLWSDNVYMVPPFLAYYGAMSNNQTLLQIAYDQIRLYRQTLMDNSTNLWKHMSDGPEAGDPKNWATGNAWVAAGIMRVIATIKATSYAGNMGNQLTDLQVWAQDVLRASQKHLTPEGLLRNYIDDDSTFVDSCATALMAAAGLRMSTMNLTNDFVDSSLTMLAGASANVNKTGYLNNVTDPLAFVKAGTYSPEGQSFLILAYSAYKEWDAMGRPGNTKGDHPLGSSAIRALPGCGAFSVILLGLLYVLI